MQGTAAGDPLLRRPPPSPRCERMGQEGARAREDHNSSSGQPPPSLSGRGALAEIPAPAPSRQASRGPPFGAQQPGADANRNAWTAEIDSRGPQETSRGACSALSERLLNARIFSFVLTNATQSQRLLRLNYKQRVSAWGAGLWAVCQGCQAAQTSIPTELRNKRTAPGPAWKLGRE